MSVTVVSKQLITVTEILPNNTGSAADSKRTVTHESYNQTRTLNAASTPPATDCAHFLLTLVAGVASIDLRALVGTNGGLVDGNGKKLQELRVKNLGANNMVFSEGAANGYAIGSFTVFPGGCAHFFYNDQSPDIAAADKIIDVAGTLAQTAEVTVIIG